MLVTLTEASRLLPFVLRCFARAWYAATMLENPVALTLVAKARLNFGASRAIGLADAPKERAATTKEKRAVEGNIVGLGEKAGGCSE